MFLAYTMILSIILYILFIFLSSNETQILFLAEISNGIKAFDTICSHPFDVPRQWMEFKIRFLSSSWSLRR